MNKVLIVDDEENVVKSLGRLLVDEDYELLTANSGQEALEVFNKNNPDAVLLDLKMPGMDGIETMGELKQRMPEVPVILITGHGDIPTAVTAIKLGAYDYIVKPPETERLVLTLKRAIEKYEMAKEIKKLDTTVWASLEMVLGSSKAMKDLAGQIRQIARTDFSIIIQGETGSGKTMLAHTIHNLSARVEKPFVKVDMSVVPESLVESELFGHEKGAFTGAGSRKQGVFETADGGTLFIDELENISLYMQSKLLGVVEEKRICPVGSSRPVAIDVRIISATNEDIRESVKNRRLREDFFYRLADYIITIPPLRERIEDIPFLAKKFLQDTALELNKDMRDISDNTVDLLMNYPWPGNVRELKNVIRRAVLFSHSGVIRPENIEFLIQNNFEDRVIPLKESVVDIEMRSIRQALSITAGNKSKAASILQIDYKTLLRKLKEYGIK